MVRTACSRSIGWTGIRLLACGAALCGCGPAMADDPGCSPVHRILMLAQWVRPCPVPTAPRQPEPVTRRRAALRREPALDGMLMGADPSAPGDVHADRADLSLIVGVPVAWTGLFVEDAETASLRLEDRATAWQGGNRNRFQELDLGGRWFLKPESGVTLGLHGEVAGRTSETRVTLDTDSVRFRFEARF